MLCRSLDLLPSSDHWLQPTRCQAARSPCGLHVLLPVVGVDDIVGSGRGGRNGIRFRGTDVSDC